MAWVQTLVISGVTSNGLIAGAQAENVDAGTIQLKRDANRVPGILNNGSILTGGMIHVSRSCEANRTTVFDGLLTVNTGATANSTIISGGSMRIDSGTAIRNTIRGGSVTVQNGGAINSTVISGGTVTVNVGEADSTVISNGSLTVKSGTASNITASGGMILLYDSGVAREVSFCGGRMKVSSGGVGSGATIYTGNIQVLNGGTVSNTIVSGGNLYVGYTNSIGGVASDTIVKGGIINVVSGGVAHNTIIVSGGSMKIADTGATEGTLTFDFTGATGNNTALIDYLQNVTAGTTLVVKISEWSGNNYTLATVGDDDASVTVTDGMATATLAKNQSVTNPFAGARYRWNGTNLVAGTYSFTATATEAAALTATAEADTVNSGDLAVKWTSATTAVTGNVYLAGTMTAGAAWVELDGYEGGAGTTLYGAQGSTFADGTVNINAKSGSLRNLAAGANAGGTVKAVNLTFAGAELDGTGYAGGFGNVTGKTATTITTGTFAKDFYAGALANKLTTATSVGDVSMTVAGGTFDGYIYGASAVKTDTTKGNGTRHTAGNVTLTVTGGASTKGNQACIFAGGYATGTATGTVYTVASVTAEISGGSWGEAAGGRGVFGGIMASGVTAQVTGDVNLTVSGDATMGNVYGGGWAQKTNGKSIVGDVNISIEGGTIANVFGGGSHSTSGGATETGDITITVSGGNITGDIYARGQLDGDITGAASVIFTGSDGFDCGVYGYSYVGGAGEGAALSFSAYTGEFSGKIGGFDGIKFDGGTAMTLDPDLADDISNGAWEFDLTGRADALAGTSLLTWDEGSFENDSIKVSFADDTQAQGGWNIATVAEAFSGTTFNVEVGGTEIASGLAYGGQIASGDYAGWGFELESGVLKFKNLASA